MLARREHSCEELKQKLISRSFDPDAVAQVVAALTREGLQSDARFAESFVHHRIEMGYGPLRIRQALKQRGVSDGLIEQSLSEAGTDWLARLQWVREKKFGKALPDNYKEQARQARFLQYRGFSPDQIRHLFKTDE